MIRSRKAEPIGVFKTGCQRVTVLHAVGKNKTTEGLRLVWFPCASISTGATVRR
jgi:hypothetical protein